MLTATLILFSQTVSLKGGVLGQNFAIEKVVIDKASWQAKARQGKDEDRADVYNISFRQGKEFFPDRELRFQLLVNPGQKFDHFSINQPAVKFGTPEHMKQMFGNSKGVSCGRGVNLAYAHIGVPEAQRKTGTSEDMIAFSLTTKKNPSGGYTATIRAKVAEQKAWVQGTFTFVVTKA